jgi:hypothetical protein
MGTQLGRDVILQVFRYLHLYDVVSLMFADVLSNFSAAATELALPVIADFDLQVETVYDLDGQADVDYEHTQPVIRKIETPTARNLPRECVIFEPEPELGKVRPSYRRGQFKPAFVKLRWRPFTFEWTLKPGYFGPAGDNMEVPLTNICKNVHDRFIVFQYWHDEDVRRLYPIKVFYKTADEKILLHCVSIPIKLLAMVLEKNCNPGDWLYSIGVLPSNVA